MSDFHCDLCLDPIHGGVSQTRCTSCLLDCETDGDCCEICDISLTPDEIGYCDACQETIDMEIEAFEEACDFDPDDAGEEEEFLRAPSQ